MPVIMPLSDIPRFRHEAMAAMFEIFLDHPDGEYARSAAGAAFRLLDELEEVLSRYRQASDVSRINRAEAGEACVVEPATYDCLALSLRMFRETGGVFDVTLGTGKKGRKFVLDETIALDEPRHAVIKQAKETRIDLGGIGKGFAIDRMAALLREWDMTRLLVRGGNSTVLAGEPPSGRKGWPIRIPKPAAPKSRDAAGKSKKPAAQNQAESTLLEHVLSRGSVSGSGLRKGPHIIDPRTGKPVAGYKAAWAFAPTAGESDALSTAFMIMPPEAIEACCKRRPAMRGLVFENGRTRWFTAKPSFMTGKNSGGNTP